MKGLKVHEDPEKRLRKEPLIASITPRNRTEKIFFDHYGTVTPIPEPTNHRKMSYRAACIFYIHQNMGIQDIARLCAIDATHLELVRREDKWDGFKQELMQLGKPSTLSTVVNHDISLVEEEQKRRMDSLPDLRTEEERTLAHLKMCQSGSAVYTRTLSALKSVRDLIADVTGLSSYLSEQSAARRAALSAFARADGLPEPPSAPKRTEGRIVETL